MDIQNEKGNGGKAFTSSEKRALRISGLAHEMLDVCRGLSVSVVKEALQQALYDCDSRSILSGRSFPDENR